MKAVLVAFSGLRLCLSIAYLISKHLPMGQFPSHALEFDEVQEEIPEEGFDVGAYDGLKLNREDAESLELLSEEKATKTTEHSYFTWQ